MVQAGEMGASQYWAVFARGQGRAGQLPVNLASFPPVLLRAHPEGRHEAAPLSWPLGLQGALVAGPARGPLQSGEGPPWTSLGSKQGQGLITRRADGRLEVALRGDEQLVSPEEIRLLPPLSTDGNDTGAGGFPSLSPCR